MSDLPYSSIILKYEEVFDDDFLISITEKLTDESEYVYIPKKKLEWNNNILEIIIGFYIRNNRSMKRIVMSHGMTVIIG